MVALTAQWCFGVAVAWCSGSVVLLVVVVLLMVLRVMQGLSCDSRKLCYQCFHYGETRRHW